MREDESGRRLSRYRKIEIRMWGDERFGRLSPIAPSGQALWLYLLTGPHTGPIPGLFKAGRAGMAEELGWDQEAFDKAFDEVFREGLVKADFKARLMWIPNAIKFNSPTSPNVVLSWAAELDLLPECELKAEALSALNASVSSMGPAFATAFDKACGKASPKPSAKPSPNQEQEQDREQERKKEAAPPPAGGSALPADPPEPSPAQSCDGGSKSKPGAAAVTEPPGPDEARKRAEAEEVLADGKASAEDRFYALRYRLEDRGVRWSLAMKLVQAEGSFDLMVGAIERALSKRDPTSYLGSVLKRLREMNGEAAPAKGRNGKHVPAWVAERRSDGFDVTADGPGRWIDCGKIYDDAENEIGF